MMRSLRLALVVTALTLPLGRAQAASTPSIDSSAVPRAGTVMSAPTLGPIYVHATAQSHNDRTRVPRVPSFPPELAFALLATARKGGRKSTSRTSRRAAAKTATKVSDVPAPLGTGPAGAPAPGAEPVVMPAAGSPLAREADKAQIDEQNARRRAAAKTARSTKTQPVTLVTGAGAPPAPPNPDESDNVSETGKFDETVEGGRYKHPDGKFRDAEGRVVK